LITIEGKLELWAMAEVKKNEAAAAVAVKAVKLFMLMNYAVYRGESCCPRGFKLVLDVVV
jgi:hypothetical protein